jgi:hypothetical protein
MVLTFHNTSLTDCDAGAWLGPGVLLKTWGHSCCSHNLAYGLHLDKESKMWVLSWSLAVDARLDEARLDD